MTVIENLDQLRDAIRAVVDYNWQSERRDFEECLDPTNENSAEGHIFFTLRDLAGWLGDGPPLPRRTGTTTEETEVYKAQDAWITARFGSGAADEAEYGKVVGNNSVVTVVPGRGTLVTDIDSLDHEWSSADFCEECGAQIPENARTVEGKWHETSCPLFAESVAPTLEERLTDESFADREPGSVSEDEYQSRLSEIQETADYLRNESVWRVEYNRAWGQNPRVSYIEASSEEDARGGEDKLPQVSEYFLECAPAHKVQVRIVSCRRATVGEDLEEFVEELGREQGWYR